jgi:hypothetical protein
MALLIFQAHNSIKRLGPLRRAVPKNATAIASLAATRLRSLLAMREIQDSGNKMHLGFPNNTTEMENPFTTATRYRRQAADGLIGYSGANGN